MNFYLYHHKSTEVLAWSLKQMTALYVTCQAWIVHRWLEWTFYSWLHFGSNQGCSFFPPLKSTCSHRILSSSYIDFLKVIKWWLVHNFERLFVKVLYVYCNSSHGTKFSAVIYHSKWENKITHELYYKDCSCGSDS